MRSLTPPLLSRRLVAHPVGRAAQPLHCSLRPAIVGALLLFAHGLMQAAPAAAAQDDFSSLVKLAPFVVNGKSLAISVYARSRSDRRYGEQFAERVAKVVHEAVTTETGKGLVIVGARGEPHPFVVFRKFLALADDGKLDPGLAARAPELRAMMARWQSATESADDADGDSGIDLQAERILPALPLPLAGIGAKLYQLAWEEKFDDAKVDAALRALRPGDLERRDRFKAFDWVFYLPPKGAFDDVLDDLIAAALKQEKMGLFARTAAQGVLLFVKPMIRRVIEGMREGLMFMTVVQAQTRLGEKEVSALTAAYIEAFVPFDADAKRPPGRNDHERAVNAVRARLQRDTEKTKARAEPAVAEREGKLEAATPAN